MEFCSTQGIRPPPTSGLATASLVEGQKAQVGERLTCCRAVQVLPTLGPPQPEPQETGGLWRLVGPNWSLPT